MVLASPVIETGVSIDIDHFHKVFAIASGVQTVEAVCQTLERVRSDVPRSLYCPERSQTRIGNGSTVVSSLLKSQKRLFKANVRSLQKADHITSLESEGTEHFRTWAKYAVVHNYGYQHYKACILEKLKPEGYEVMELNSEHPKTVELHAMTKQIQESNYEKERISISEKLNPDNGTLETLQEKRNPTKHERHTKKKGILCRRYKTEDITPEMIEKDDNGWFTQLMLHYYLTVGYAFLSIKETKKLEQLTENSNGQVFTPDVGHNFLSAQIQCLKAINMEQFFNTETVLTSENLKEWFEPLKMNQNRRAIKTFLNQSIGDNDSAVGFLQRTLLSVFGLKLMCLGQRTIDGKRVRCYQMKNLDPDNRTKIFERWMKRDQTTHLPINNNNYQEGCA